MQTASVLFNYDDDDDHSDDSDDDDDVDLAEDLVEVSLVRKERDHHEDREQEERHDCFPEINFVLGIKRILSK